MTNRPVFWIGASGWVFALALAGWLLLHRPAPPSPVSSDTSAAAGTEATGSTAPSVPPSSVLASVPAAPRPLSPREADTERKYRRVQELRSKGDLQGLRALLKDPGAARWAADALMGAEGEHPDPSTTQAMLSEIVRNPQVDTNDRAMVLQDLLLKGRVEAREWAVYAMKQPQSVLRWHGFNYALRNLPVKQSVPMVLPYLDEPDPETRAYVFQLLREATGSFELPPDRAAWEAWWRKEGEALFNKLP